MRERESGEDVWCPVDGPAEVHPLRDFLVGLTGTEGRDVRSWSQAVGPVLLFALVIINGLFAWGAWTAATSVFFPSLGQTGSLIAGVIGGLLILTIDWMVVSYHPSLPTWFVAGHDKSPPSRWARLLRALGFVLTTQDGHPAPTTNETSPPLPTGWPYFRSYLVRLLFALGIAAFVGTGLSIAANKDSVVDTRRQLAIKATREEEDEARNKILAEHPQRVEEQLTWLKATDSIRAQIEEVTKARDANQAQKAELEQLIKCESPADNVPRTGVCEGIEPSWEGWQRKVDDKKQNQVLVDQQIQEIKKMQASIGTEPAVPPIPPPSTSTTPNPKFEQGLGPTLSAYFTLARAWPWYLEFSAFLLMLMIDVAPVVFKMLWGYTVADQRAWSRQVEEVRRRREHERQERLNNVDAEIELLSHHAHVIQQAADARHAARVSEEVSAATRAQLVETAVEETKAGREATVAAAADMAADQAVHDREQARLDREHAARLMQLTREHEWAEATASFEPDSPGPDRGDDATPADDAYRPGKNPNDRSGPWPDASEPRPTALDEFEMATPSEDLTPLVENARRTHPRWGMAEYLSNRFSTSDIWEDDQGEIYVYGPSIVPHENYSKSVARLMVKAPPRPGTAIDKRTLPSKCKVSTKIDHSRLPLERVELLQLALPRCGKAVASRGGIGLDQWVSPYYPRTDVERFLAQVGAQDMGLRYQDIASWGTELLDNLRQLHEVGLAHNDIKPKNVVVGGDVLLNSTEVTPVRGGVHLIDFGSISPIVSTPGPGTPLWMSPERISNPDDAGDLIACDLFTAAGVLFYAVTSRRVNQVVNGSGSPSVGDQGWMKTYEVSWSAGALRAALREVPTVLSDIILDGLHPTASQRPKLWELRDSLSAAHGSSHLQRKFTPEVGAARPSGFDQDIVRHINKVGWEIRD